MRFWLKSDERRPSPAPVATDDRLAFLVGLAAWVAALAAMLVFLEPLRAAGNLWWLWTAITGVALGLIGLLYTHVRGRRKA
jgi:FtsH-binding integral membrane protein